MLMIGDPGTGKSMLARSMTDLLPRDVLEDVLVYPNAVSYTHLRAHET